MMGFMQSSGSLGREIALNRNCGQHQGARTTDRDAEPRFFLLHRWSRWQLAPGRDSVSVHRHDVHRRIWARRIHWRIGGWSVSLGPKPVMPPLTVTSNATPPVGAGVVQPTPTNPVEESPAVPAPATPGAPVTAAAE